MKTRTLASLLVTLAAFCLCIAFCSHTETESPERKRSHVTVAQTPLGVLKTAPSKPAAVESEPQTTDRDSYPGKELLPHDPYTYNDDKPEVPRLYENFETAMRSTLGRIYVLKAPVDMNNPIAVAEAVEAHHIMRYMLKEVNESYMEMNASQKEVAAKEFSTFGLAPSFVALGAWSDRNYDGVPPREALEDSLKNAIRNDHYLKDYPLSPEEQERAEHKAFIGIVKAQRRR